MAGRADDDGGGDTVRRKTQKKKKRKKKIKKIKSWPLNLYRVKWFGIPPRFVTFVAEGVSKKRAAAARSEGGRPKSRLLSIHAPYLGHAKYITRE